LLPHIFCIPCAPQATIKGTALELQSLRRERAEVQTQLDRQREEADRQKMAAEAATRSNTLLRERLALYSGAALEGVGASCCLAVQRFSCSSA
jgi:hypothetical protein